jgi:hypothetical protein
LYCVGGNLRLVMGFKMRCDWIVACFIVYQWVRGYSALLFLLGCFSVLGGNVKEGYFKVRINLNYKNYF